MGGGMRKTKPRNLLRWCVGLFLTFAFIAMRTSDIAAKIGLDLEWRPIEGVEPPPVKEEKPEEKRGDAQKPGKAGETRSFTVNGVSFKMVRIPAGEFMMGSPSDEPDRGKNETQHQVRISRDFWMGQTEVTQGLWKAVMGSNPSHFSNCGDDCPLELVSWNDCQEFIRKLNGMVSGGNFRLPTEAEWEYACRAGSTTPFNTGRCLKTDQANYDGNYPYIGCSKGEYRKRPVRAGSYSANAWGLYDMHGNVWEWCQDWYGDYPSGSVTDPTGPSGGSNRVCRGGSWLYDAGFCRSADRRYGTPDDRSYYLGLRLARTR
jgi:formylglycine-generating enzyme